jgi:eukaryotic-like serine/threonine-protein kinase
MALQQDVTSEFAGAGSLARTSETNAATTTSRELGFLKPSEDPAYIGRLDRFEIARVIGRGGMGIVLEGFDTHLQRSVAIKVLNPEYQKNDIARQRFCREGRAAAAISHEHVVAMHQVAKEDESDIAYLVMQLIDGETLESRMSANGAMPTEEAARLGMQIAAGLSAAHSRGMIHRDIKPANILIERETDRVKLTDFGLARASDDVKLTKTGMVTGTPLYMSPEQATGATIDERSDLFSLGAVIYEMATGLSPFQAPSLVGVMKRIMDEMPAPPHKINASVKKPFSDLILSMLAKKPEERQASAAAVATALASIVTEYGPISPLQVPAVAAAQVKRISGSHRAMQQRWVVGAWLAGGFGALCLVATLATLFGSSRKLDNDNSNQNGSNSASVGNEPAKSSLPSIVLAGNPGTVWSVDFSPQGNTVAAAIEDGSVRLWNIETKQVSKSFNAHRGIVWCVRFHPSRSIVATSGDDGFVKIWDGETFDLIHQWNAGSAVRGIAFSPDGNRIVVGDRGGNIRVYDIGSTKELETHSQSGSIFGIAYSSDGKLIATVASDKIVRVWDSTTFAERQTLHGHSGPIYNVAFAPSGPLMATVGWGKNVRVWNVESGIEVKNLIGSRGDVWGVVFCPKSDHLVTTSQDGTARIWDLTSGDSIATLEGHESAVHNVAISASTKRIATSGRDGTIRIWDLSELAVVSGGH